MMHPLSLLPIFIVILSCAVYFAGLLVIRSGSWFNGNRVLGFGELLMVR
ncbi:hypothetical protein HRbin02_01747 [Candidatus Calditenuaceae archaeon HR02]|nr:hypothetical protein HRbin02_01747 [Candidatus Calditenuaceae archaeon HR02]